MIKVIFVGVLCSILPVLIELGTKLIIKRIAKKEEAAAERDFLNTVKVNKICYIIGMPAVVFGVISCICALYSDNSEDKIDFAVLGVLLLIIGVYMTAYYFRYGFEWDFSGFTSKKFFSQKYYSFDEIKAVYYHNKGLMIVTNDNKKHCVVEEYIGAERMSEYIIEVTDDSKLYSSYFEYKNKED